MGRSKYKDVGGGPAVGVADDFSSFLKSVLMGGGTQSTQMMNAAGGPGGNGPGGIGAFMADLLGAGGGRLGGILGDQTNRENARARNDVRSQFSSIGGGYGSGTAQALSMFDAENANKGALNIAGMQLSAIQPLLQLINSFAQKGVSQRTTVEQRNPWLQALQAAGGVAKTAASFAIPGGAGGASLSGDTGFGISAPPPMYGLKDYSMPALPRTPLPWERH